MTFEEILATYKPHPDYSIMMFKVSDGLMFTVDRSDPNVYKWVALVCKKRVIKTKEGDEQIEMAQKLISVLQNKIYSSEEFFEQLQPYLIKRTNGATAGETN